MASPAAVVSPAASRLKKEYRRLCSDPVAHIEAVPSESNILEWHYVIHGPPGSPYYGGAYHGKLVFPKDYPYKPPAIYMITPNGRFKTNTRLCLSMSDFHPETWNPLWSVSSILSGLLSFMLETTPTYGSLDCSDEVKRACATKSRQFNRDNPQFRKHFPDLDERLAQQEREREEQKREQREEKQEVEIQAQRTNASTSTSDTRSTATATTPPNPFPSPAAATAPAPPARAGHPDTPVDRVIIGAVVVALLGFIVWLYKE